MCYLLILQKPSSLQLYASAPRRKTKNLVDAYKWYDLAARDGMLDEKVRTKARGKIGQLALNLSSSDIASARSKADSWFQSK